ncbi:MAG: hypothetical protein U1G07_15225 [Verrucomicrobiota bacterium]
MKTLRLKTFCSCLALILLAAFAPAGCSKKIAVDTVNLQYSFQTADDATQTTLNQAIEAIDKGDRSAALESLKKLAADPKTTAEQKTALTGVIAQLEK